ncbi:immune inhibitor A [Janibacter sp. YIM B02568]|uniref:immune inhibitor A domain-containing protein n=1 Tax=Janibacter endophyticus TaxID=2806261 RepID=UPI00195088F2|nr:immune inhibitor A domain-containing protein [Janibacter endophyticus]MBM6546608.1 immune inhibitor A [Janibacter endophyticus]
MKRRHSTALAGIATSALILAFVPTSATAGSTPAPPQGEPTGSLAKVDDKSHPLGDAQRALREAAVDKLVSGDAEVTTKNGKRVIELKAGKGKKGKGKHKNKYVQYDVNREANLFTILTDFGEETMPVQGGDPGPMHNEIAEPDRVWDGDATDNNSTMWRADFDRDHYMDLMFGEKESMRDFYLKQSNGRFFVKGDVSEWVKVPYNEARYGHNPVEGDGTSEAEGYWSYIRDTAQAWYDDQVAQGKSLDEIKSYLSQFDVWDRYDHDGDGDFDEPDGYIDHFQAIHAGEGEDAGGGAQGEDAIWSHRWYAFANEIGKTGPSTNKLGGVPLGDTGIWIGDYTTEPENGGLGVFAHEFAHDLGLPDLYDTSGGDNGTGFWTLMSAGSWLGHSKEDIGTSPGYMGAWEKLQLGWSDVKVVASNQKTTTGLGPADRDQKKLPQALAVTLPNKTITTEYNTPHSGTSEWWTGSGDNLNNTLTRAVDLTGKSSASISAWVDKEIEAEYDNLWIEASTDGGANWTQLGDPITGGELGSWTQETRDLTPFAGQAIQVRFRYSTDGGLAPAGGFIDDITITADGATLLSDDVESGENGWTAKGFTISSGTTEEEVSHYYLAENRVYQGYDKNLKTGPYNFGFANTRPDWVERFPYQNGMLVWYINNEYSDNNTRVHPGAGQVLPVDARPKPVTFADGALLGNRRQPFDATFGLERTDKVTFHRNGVPTTVPSQRAMPTFDDSDPERYWSAANPWSSVKVAGTGTKIQVLSGTGDTMNVRVQPRR